MKKIAIFLFIFVFFGLVSWACRRPLPVFPNPPGSVTPTPTSTVVTTPGCAFTPLPNTVNLLIKGPYYVIQNQTEWTNANGAGATVPPVNFSNQMILEYSQGITCSCMCSPVPPTITSVCFYSNYIEVDYQIGGVYCPPPPGYTCNSLFWTNYQAMAAVPQSNLPVSWVGH